MSAGGAVARLDRQREADDHRFGRVEVIGEPLEADSERTRARSSAALNGLLTKSSAPASMPRMRLAESERRDQDDRNQPRARVLFSARHASKPSTCGIRTSGRTRSGGSSRTSLSASAPPPAVRTAWPSGLSSDFDQPGAAGHIVNDEDSSP